MENQSTQQSLDLEKENKVNRAKRSSNKRRGRKCTTTRNMGTDARGKDMKSPWQDPSWYTKYPELVDAVANLPWRYIAGTKLETISDRNNNEQTFVTFPGVMRLPFLPSMGITKSDDADGLNTIARVLWTSLHRVFRGLGTYEKSDSMFMLYAIINLYALIARAERVYGLLNHYTLLNRNIPYTLAAALNVPEAANGLSGEDLANFRSTLNYLIIQTRALALPRGFSVLDRYIEMLSHVFKDSESERAAMFVFDMDAYYRYAATDITTGGALHLIYLKDTYDEGLYDNYIDPIQDALKVLLEDEDVTQFCSDMIAASSKLSAQGSMSIEFVHLEALPADYTVIPVKRDDWLEQIHNIKFVPTVQHACTNPELNVDLHGGSAQTYHNYIFQQDNKINAHYCFIPDIVAEKDIDADYLKATSSIDSSNRAIVGVTINKPSTLDDAYSFRGHIYTHEKGVLLDSDKESLSKEQVIEITRGVCLSRLVRHSVTGTGGAVTLEVTDCGSEIFTTPILYSRDAAIAYGFFGNTYARDDAYKGDDTVVSKYFDWCFEIPQPNAEYSAASIQLRETISNHNLTVTIHSDKLSGQPNMEIDNPTFISRANIAPIHDMCIISEFSVDVLTNPILK